MGFFKTLGKWIRFVLFIGLMGAGDFFTIVMMIEEKGFRIVLCILCIILSILNCVLYFLKLKKDNQLFACIGSLLLCGLYFYLAITSEANTYGIGAAFSGGAIVLCLTNAAFTKLTAILTGDAL